MNEQAEHSQSLTKHIVLGVIIVAVVVVLYFWLSADEPEPVAVEPAPVVELPEPEPEALPAEPEYEPEPEPVIEEPVIEEPLPEPEPLDVSDATVKTSILDLTNYEAAASLLVNDDLIQRFVVLVANMSDGETAPNHQILVPPTQNFRIYKQAGKEWIDAASYKRYTPYVDAVDAMDSEILVSLYEKYKPAITDQYLEIASSEDDFNYVLVDAINHLLDTPEVPVPVEVYSESVMYKYRDPRLEALSSPQKHLLRMGPENMRRIKAKLREVKEILQ